MRDRILLILGMIVGLIALPFIIITDLFKKKGDRFFDQYKDYIMGGDSGGQSESRKA